MATNSWFNEYIPYIIMSIIWVSMTLLALIVYFLFPPEIYFWDKVFEDCNISSADYRYIIRFIYGSYKQTFDITNTSITIEIWNSEQAMIALDLPPNQLEKSTVVDDSENLKVCKFLLYRREPLLDICNLVVNHNGMGSINVTTIEIQEVSDKKANIAYIGQPIHSLSREKANTVQMFPSASREKRTIESDLIQSQTLSALEFIIILFFALNIILLLCAWVIPCNIDEMCNDYGKGLIASTLSALASSTATASIFIVQCLLFRYLIKHYLYFNDGKGCCLCVKHVFLILLLFSGAIFGFTGAYLASKFPEVVLSGQKYSHQIYWLIAIGMSITFFFLFWLSTLSIVGFLIGFFSNPEDKAEEKADPSRATTTSEQEDYYSALLGSNKRVKSISQYRGSVDNKTEKSDKSKLSERSAAGKPNKNLSQTPKESKLSKVSRSKSNESMGDNYYQQLVQGKGRIKSVSQYKGVNASSK